ncbi:Ubiquitin carboxyl-terminal hydrolase 12 [Sesamum angolense]|uniref:ubiquitinyl hydrolase 1 n=1 Tax=Sesamum angolense TaxID=2727404 RepID=A0AAE1XCT4_9LAMI|nr:Ubiquitin carboxyl-terminal hydrolase 12 [Sesamum angolense]
MVRLATSRLSVFAPWKGLERMNFVYKLSKLDSYDEVVERVANQLRVDDPSKIRLTSHNMYSQQPKTHPIRYRGVENLLEMLLHYDEPSDVLYFEVLDIPLPELQELRILNLAFSHVEKTELESCSVRLQKDSTVGDVLEDLRKKVELSRPSAELRLLDIFAHKIYKQIQNFGEPFLLMISDGETLSHIKARVQNKLKVKDEEFSKWKFAFVSCGQVEYLEASDTLFNHFQLSAIRVPWEQYLGLEHISNTPRRPAAAYQFYPYVLKPSIMLQHCDESDDILLLFNLYEPEKGKLRYARRLCINSYGEPTGILEKLNELARYAGDEEIELFEYSAAKALFVMCLSISRRRLGSDCWKYMYPRSTRSSIVNSSFSFIHWFCDINTKTIEKWHVCVLEAISWTRSDNPRRPTAANQRTTLVSLRPKYGLHRTTSNLRAESSSYKISRSGELVGVVAALQSGTHSYNCESGSFDEETKTTNNTFLFILVTFYTPKYWMYLYPNYKSLRILKLAFRHAAKTELETHSIRLLEESTFSDVLEEKVWRLKYLKGDE